MNVKLFFILFVNYIEKNYPIYFLKVIYNEFFWQPTFLFKALFVQSVSFLLIRQIAWYLTAAAFVFITHNLQKHFVLYACLRIRHEVKTNVVTTCSCTFCAILQWKFCCLKQCAINLSSCIYNSIGIILYFKSWDGNASGNQASGFIRLRY